MFLFLTEIATATGTTIAAQMPNAAKIVIPIKIIFLILLSS
jgi:hypothetical protein